MEKAYRKNAAALIFNKDKKVLLCQRFEENEHNWQFPQGGVDPNEDVKTAVFREIVEETSITSVKLIHSIEKPFYYDFPIDLSHFNYRGQEQYWSLLYFYGDDNEINLNTKEPEFRTYKWVDINEAVEKVTYFKQETYKNAISILEPIINDYEI